MYLLSASLQFGLGVRRPLKRWLNEQSKNAVTVLNAAGKDF
jgi:hypothetical protein